MNIRVVILAAGQGKRMGGSVPKPLIPVGGKPMIEHLVDAVVKSGVDARPVVVVSPSAKELFVATLGGSVEFAVQVQARGTGDALKAAREACVGADGVMVLYGDHPFLPSKTMQELRDMAVENSEAVVMLTARVPNFEGDYAPFVSWAKILRNEEGEVTAIREKKDATDEEKMITEVNPGMYVFPAPWVWGALEQVSTNNASGEFYLTDLIKIALAQKVIMVSKTVDALQVMGVNTPDELATLEKIRYGK